MFHTEQETLSSIQRDYCLVDLLENQVSGRTLNQYIYVGVQ